MTSHKVLEACKSKHQPTMSTKIPHTNACSVSISRSTGTEDNQSAIGLTPAVSPAEKDEKMLPRAEASASSAAFFLSLSLSLVPS